MLPEQFADLASFTRDIEVLSTVLEARELKFVGGEPLLHPQLLDFIRVAKESSIANSLVLVTNGVLLHKAPEELWSLIDGMWISVYPGVKFRFDWEWIQRIADEHKIFVWRKETPRFVESSLIEEIRSEELVQMVYQNCDQAHLYSCHTVYQGRYYICEPSVWVQSRLRLHGIDFKNRDADSIPIHDNPHLHDDLDELVRRKQPLAACRYCLGVWARSTPNEQLSRSGIQTFLTRKQDDLAELVNGKFIVPRPYTDQSPG
jgi:hypothetical protein